MVVFDGGWSYYCQPWKIQVSWTCVQSLVGLLFFQSHRCLFVIAQASNMSQWSGTDCSSHHRASTSKAQMFSSSWRSWKHGMSSQRCSIFHVGQHLPLQLLRLGFHLTASTQLWQRGEHLERRIGKPTFTSEVVRLTYGSGSRRGEDVYICGAAGRC